MLMADPMKRANPLNVTTSSERRGRDKQRGQAAETKKRHDADVAG